MHTKGSAIPRQALVSLLVRAERAAAEGDEAKAASLLSDLHWFAHDDGQLHQAMHRLEREIARRRGDVGALVRQVLPNAFARAISFTESLGPSHEVTETIAAPPEAVYDALADVASYGEWNPWIVKGEGTAGQVGDEVVVDAKIGKGRMRVGHRVIVASPPQRFGWFDLGWFTPFASGRRLRWVEPTAEGARLVSQIRLYGPFAHLAWWLHGESIRTGMAAEASALGVRAASAARPASRASVKRGAGDEKPLIGTTCVVTGPTHGIGLPTALTLGELGARVVLLCRNREKGNAVARELASRGAESVVVPVDLASLRSVDDAAARVLELFPRIDCLINNAGVLNHERRVTVDGFEEGFGVNFLAHFLLTHRLLPALSRAPAARIVHVSSNSHPIVGRFDFSDYNWERRRFIGIPAYAHSKLAILLANRALARRLSGTNILSNAVHPGVIATGMGTDHPRFAKFLNPLAERVFLTPEEGALGSIYVATSPSVDGHRGEYFSGCRVGRPSRAAQDDVAAERLHHLAESLLAERGFAAVGRAA
jgi:NAD(P)-dependent dehydrogenase (short-subunit alcohol dehydrogenase family)